MTDVVALSAEDFTGPTLRREGVWMVDFFTPWCAPCKAVESVFEELSGNSDSGAHFSTLNIADHPETAKALEVASAPTIIIFVNGAEQRRLFGAKTARQLTSAIEAVGAQNRE
jgi:thioredoxin 1